MAATTDCASHSTCTTRWTMCEQVLAALKKSMDLMVREGQPV